ncbi:hypothetical protein ABK040_008310 [Willaertia magna]
MCFNFTFVSWQVQKNKVLVRDDHCSFTTIKLNLEITIAKRRPSITENCYYRKHKDNNNNYDDDETDGVEDKLMYSDNNNNNLGADDVMVVLINNRTKEKKVEKFTCLVPEEQPEPVSYNGIQVFTLLVNDIWYSFINSTNTLQITTKEGLLYESECNL